MLRICIGYNVDPDPAFISMWIRIRIQVAKLKRIHAYPDQDTPRNCFFFLSEPPDQFSFRIRFKAEK